MPISTWAAGAIVIGLAAVIIGEALLSRVFHNFALKMLSVAVGSVIYYLVYQVVIWFKVDTDMLKAFQRRGGGHLPGHPVLEGQILHQTHGGKGGRQECLRSKNVYKTFNAGTVNQKVALNGLDLTLEDGDFVTVIGGNGAGKSTMLNAVAGVWPSTWARS